MHDDDDLYGRQTRLPEVGPHGQARITDAVLEVNGGDGAIIEAEYLHRAGVQRLMIFPGAEAVPFAHQHAFRFFASRRIGAGAWRALRQIRRVLCIDA
jgi:hypothetical protein